MAESPVAPWYALTGGDILHQTPLTCRLFRWIALECGQWERQPLPLQSSISRIGTGCGRAEARPYNTKPTPENHQTRDYLMHVSPGRFAGFAHVVVFVVQTGRPFPFTNSAFSVCSVCAMAMTMCHQTSTEPEWGQSAQGRPFPFTNSAFSVCSVAMTINQYQS